MNHPALSPDSLEARARRRVRTKLAFLTHALVFVLVNATVYGFAEFTGRPHRSAMFFGWGLGLLIHGIVTFARLQGEGLRERMIRQEIARMKQKQPD